ncbi:hypothetical protein [Holzapfeliella sp. JNUCC 72]
MKKYRVFFVFLFLLFIPYICSLALIATAYNALVLHADDIFRTLIGALTGGFILYAMKATIQRPLDLIGDQIRQPFLKQFVRFFSIQRRFKFKIANLILDIVMSGIATVLIRVLVDKSIIMNQLAGFFLIIMFFSTALGAYVEYDHLSVDSPSH